MATNITRQRATDRRRTVARVWWLDSAVLYPLVAISHLAMMAIGGVSRYYFAQVGLLPLGYVTNVLVVVAMTGWFIARVGTLRFKRLDFLVVSILVCSLAVAACTGRKPVAAAFGVYILMPFLLGVVASKELFGFLLAKPKIMLIIWAVTFVGLVLDSVMNVPWSGFSFDVGGVTVSASREWSFEGTRRVAGFARTSFDASAYLLTSAIFILVSTKRTSFATLIWLLTGVGIALTTTKGLLLAYAINTLGWLFMRTTLRKWLILAPAGLGCFVVGLPLLTLITTFSLVSGGSFVASAFASFFVRLAYTWPDAWALLDKTGSLVFGTGIGGIGTPQMMFDPDSYNSADNLFVYGYFIVGLAIIPFLYWFVVRAGQQVRFVGRDQIATLSFQLAIAILAYGITTNVVELGAISLFFGALCKWFYVGARMTSSGWTGHSRDRTC